MVTYTEGSHSKTAGWEWLCLIPSCFLPPWACSSWVHPMRAALAQSLPLQGQPGCPMLFSECGEWICWAIGGWSPQRKSWDESVSRPGRARLTQLPTVSGRWICLFLTWALKSTFALSLKKKKKSRFTLPWFSSVPFLGERTQRFPRQRGPFQKPKGNSRDVSEVSFSLHGNQSLWEDHALSLASTTGRPS